MKLLVPLCTSFLFMIANKWLNKTFKGRYIEHLEQFLLSLDHKYVWSNYHFSTQTSKTKIKFFFCFYLDEMESLIVVSVDRIENNSYPKSPSSHYRSVNALDLKTYVIDAVYTKQVKLEYAEFDYIIEHIRFLYE